MTDPDSEADSGHGSDERFPKALFHHPAISADALQALFQSPLIKSSLERLSAPTLIRFSPEILAEVEELREQFDKEMQSKHLPVIRCVDDWVHLARIVEIPESEIDHISPRVIKARAFAWIDRERIRNRIANEERAKPVPHFAKRNDGKKQRKQNGTKRDYDAQVRDKEIFDDWQRARESGVLKADFARDRNLSIDNLKKLINRVAKRKSRSDTSRGQ